MARYIIYYSIYLYSLSDITIPDKIFVTLKNFVTFVE